MPPHDKARASSFRFLSSQIDRCAVNRIAEACASPCDRNLRAASANLVLLARSVPLVESSYRFEANPMACILAYIGQHFRLLPISRSRATALNIETSESMLENGKRVPWRAVPVGYNEKQRMLKRLLLGYSIITNALMDACHVGRTQGEGDELSARCVSMLLATVMKDVHEGPFTLYLVTPSILKRSELEPIKLRHGRAYRKRGTVLLVYDSDTDSDILSDTYRFLQAKGELFCRFVDNTEGRTQGLAHAGTPHEKDHPPMEAIRRRGRRRDE